MAECNDYEGLRINPTPSSIGNQYAGVSTSDKPTGVPTYSIYLERDTGKFYYYDGAEWNEIPCACGGGGDEPSLDPFRICFSGLNPSVIGLENEYTLADAMNDGIFVLDFESSCIEMAEDAVFPPQINFEYVSTNFSVKTGGFNGETLANVSSENPTAGPFPVGDGISYYIQGSIT